MVKAQGRRRNCSGFSRDLTCPGVLCAVLQWTDTASISMSASAIYHSLRGR
jgi:hypothetical protein